MSRDSIAILPGYSGKVEGRNRPFLSIGLATLAFIVLAFWVESGNSIAFDISIREAIHQIASPALTRCEVAITTLGAGIVLWPLGTAITWWMAVQRGRRTALLFALTILSADLVSQLLKLGFHRIRPQVYFGLSPAWSYSFPSGHALMSTVFYGTVAALGFQGRGRTRTLVVALAALGGLLIGLSRVYLGYHYPSDVLGGWILALLWLIMVRMLRREDAEETQSAPDKGPQKAPSRL